MFLLLRYPGGKAKRFTAVKLRQHGSTQYYSTYRQFTKPRSRYSSLVRGPKQYTMVPHVSFCNTTGVSLTCIVQAKWINSYGIVSLLSFTTQAQWSLGKQPVTYPSCAALIPAAAARAQVPYTRTRIETRCFTFKEKKTSTKAI